MNPKKKIKKAMDSRFRGNDGTHTTPNQSVKYATPITSTKTVKPTRSNKPTRSSIPTSSVMPASPVNPADSVMPAGPVNPASPVMPAGTVMPAKAGIHKNQNKKTKTTFYRNKIKRNMVYLGDVAQIISGQSPKGQFYNEKKKGIPFYQGKKEFGEIYLKNPAKWTISVTKTAKPNDILMSVRAPVGPVNITLQKICIGRGLASIRGIESKINQMFLFHYLKHNQDKFIGGGGSIFDSISQESIKAIKIPLPPLNEQKKIVDILSTWDQAIEKTNKLILAKKNQFKWLLKRLITDPKNNPKWQKAKLGELGLISSSGVDKKVIENEEAVRLVNYLDVLHKNFICSDDLNHWVTAPKNKIDKCNIKKGDIFFTPSSEIQGDIAHSAVVVEDIEKAVYSYHIVRFRLKENWDIKFRAYIFKSNHFYKQAFSICQGSGQRYVISQDDFRKMNIYFPPSVLDQKNIGDILAMKEKEIDLLKQISEKYQKQKKGLMQQLLTGQKRLY